MVESTKNRLNSRQMAMEKRDDDPLGFRILGKPEVTSGGFSVGSNLKSTVNDFRGAKLVSFLWRVPIQRPSSWNRHHYLYLKRLRVAQNLRTLSVDMIASWWQRSKGTVVMIREAQPMFGPLRKYIMIAPAIIASGGSEASNLFFFFFFFIF